MRRISAIVPIKLYSRRLPGKNFKLLGPKPLLRYIFETLLETEVFDHVYCYTSYPQILDILPKKIKLILRPKRLDADHIQANELFQYAVESVDSDFVALCQAPSPFLKKETIEKGCGMILDSSYDSVVSVRKIQTYCWYKNKPLNYEPKKMLQTQQLTAVLEETSALYIFKKNDYLETNTRINGRVGFVETDQIESIDIDETKDFKLAQGYLSSQGVDHNAPEFFINYIQHNEDLNVIEHFSFDLDGVLIDSLKVMSKSWQAVAEKLAIDVEFDKYENYVGLPFENILKNLLISPSLFEKITRVYQDESIKNEDSIVIYKGVKDLLRYLNTQKVKVSLVTSKSQFRTERILNKYFADIVFDAVITPEKVVRGKPSPDSLLYACVLTGVNPSRSFYLGDMETDWQCAKSAGIKFGLAGWGYGKADSPIQFSTVDLFYKFASNFTENVTGECKITNQP